MAWSPERGCAGKHTHLTKHAAKAMSRAVSSKNRLHGDADTHVYRCPGCGYYHVGHPIGTRGDNPE